MPDDTNHADAVKARETYFAVMGHRLDEQLRTVEALDSKVAAVFGFSSLTAGIFSALITTASQPDFSNVGLVFLSVLAAGYVGAVIFALLAYQVSEWSYRPNWTNFKDNLNEYSYAVIQDWLGDECYESLCTNEPRVRRKANFLWWQITFTAIQAAGMLAVAVTVVLD